MTRYLPILLACSLAAQGKLTPEQRQALPPPASRQIEFAEIKSILETSCMKCHGRGKSKGGFAIDDREHFLRGGDSGPAVVLGQSAESRLIELVSGLDPDNVMPQKGSRLKPEQIGILRAWIDQGAAWDPTVTFGKLPPVNLFPRTPAVPKGTAANPIDRFLELYYRENHVATVQPVTDRIYARRVYLDLVGLLPPVQELDEFVADRRPDKRARLARELLSRNQAYAEHWLTFWNDALRNDYKGTGYIDGGRKQITGWLYSALATNMPYDVFVAQLVNPLPESEGFAKGIVWRGVVNASQTPEMQAAQNISQVFMGANIKCASCHDSFINDWALSDSYGLASIYSDKPLEMFQCDKPTGKKAHAKFIYSELGEMDDSAPRAQRLKRLAEVITDKQNGRLSRTIVNRLWSKLMGRGLIEPVDEMDKPAWNIDLLDWVASDLVSNRYDLKKTLELMVTSAAYQRPAVPVNESLSRQFVFAGPLVRRMTAEQYLDALGCVTGLWNPTAAAPVNFDAAGTGSVNTLSPAPKWIWNDANAASAVPPGTLYVKKVIDLPEGPTEGSIIVACDNAFTLFVNGQEAGSGKDVSKLSLIPISKHLRAGKNTIAIQAVNDPGNPSKKDAEQKNPAGLLAFARLRTHQAVEKKLLENVRDFVSDSSWSCATNRSDDWKTSETIPSEWVAAVEIGNLQSAPWKIENKFAPLLASAARYGKIRASLVAANALTTALGRPNREQVITTRASAATTLQALELTNGATLAGYLKEGAERLLSELPADADGFVAAFYERALNRPPGPSEIELTRSLLKTPLQREAVEDLLWATAMLPEFQLIY